MKLAAVANLLSTNGRFITPKPALFRRDSGRYYLSTQRLDGVRGHRHMPTDPFSRHNVFHKGIVQTYVAIMTGPQSSLRKVQLAQQAIKTLPLEERKPFVQAAEALNISLRYTIHMDRRIVDLLNEAPVAQQEISSLEKAQQEYVACLIEPFLGGQKVDNDAKDRLLLEILTGRNAFHCAEINFENPSVVNGVYIDIAHGIYVANEHEPRLRQRIVDFTGEFPNCPNFLFLVSKLDEGIATSQKTGQRWGNGKVLEKLLSTLLIGKENLFSMTHANRIQALEEASVNERLLALIEKPLYATQPN